MNAPLRATALVLLLAPVAGAGTNLLTNPGAETGDLTGWTDPLGNGFEVETNLVLSGAFSFTGGQFGPAGVWSQEIYQEVDLAHLAAAVDAGSAHSTFDAWARSNEAGGWVDTARIVVEFRDAPAGAVLATFDTGNVGPWNTWNAVSDARAVPAGTRAVRVRLLAARSIGSSTDGFFDDLSLVIDAPATYCTAGTSASGCQALLSAAGIPSATAGAGFVLSAAGVEGAKDGLFFYGANGRQANPWGNGSSYQCVVPPVRRAGLLAGSGTPGSCDGAFSQDLNALWAANPAKNPGAGALVQAQLWYRDPQSSSNQTTSLSDAIEFAVQP